MILEYSANLDTAELALPALFAKLHEAAVNTGIFPLAGLRSRAIRCEDFRVADGNPDFAFAHLTVRLGTGRAIGERRLAAEQFFTILGDHLQPEYERRGLAISLEMQELHAELKFNRNNLRDHLAVGTL